jgi:hypothetical protein
MFKLIPRNDESKWYRFKVIVVWIYLLVGHWLACQVYVCSKIAADGKRAIRWEGELMEWETNEGIRPDNYPWHVCLRNYWTIGPWEPAYWHDEI